MTIGTHQIVIRSADERASVLEVQVQSRTLDHIFGLDSRAETGNPQWVRTRLPPDAGIDSILRLVPSTKQQVSLYKYVVHPYPTRSNPIAASGSSSAALSK